MELRNAWSSYTSLVCQYRETSKRLKANVKLIKKSSNIDADVDSKIVSQMAEESIIVADELHRKVLYSYNMLSEEELELFTDRQREVLELRQKYKPKKVAEILGITPQTVFDIYKSAVNKIEKIYNQKTDGLNYCHTSRRDEVWRLYKQGLKYKEIAEFLNISINSVKTHIRLKKGEYMP